DRLHELIALLKRGLQHSPWHLMNSDTPIQPLVIGENRAAMRISEELGKRGLLVPAIRPPTVPIGTARLRISLSAAHELRDVQALVDALSSLQ
ncbi:MAG TPA: aminotransferase class I/II-fold pyridoxal phosphate-dependent enzyme, partial [Burkholderiales bacterium]|nr:aminotransferase class I/II-fold pyridoxal phosphate-dependent enzyme [Burkholderiales bacterium]